MSGGHYDYAFGRLNQFIDDLELRPRTPEPGWEGLGGETYVDYALRARFKEHLVKVSEAMRAIEWNDSSDGAPREQELIKRCLGER